MTGLAGGGDKDIPWMFDHVYKYQEGKKEFGRSFRYLPSYPKAYLDSTICLFILQ